MSLFEASLIPALDENGETISGATWSFFASGTTTPVAVYADAALTVSLGSFVVANAEGRFPAIYYNSRTPVRAILRDGDGVPIPRGDIDPIGSGKVDAQQIAFRHPASSAVDRSVRDKLLEVVSIADFGAKTGDTDNSEAFQKAIDYLKDTGGGSLYIPSGRWRKSDLTLPLYLEGMGDLTIYGDGPTSVLFHDDRATNPRNDLFYAENCGTLTFRNFAIDGTLQTYPTEENFCQTLVGRNIDTLRVEGMTFTNLRQMAMDWLNVRDVTAIGNRLVDVLRDGLRFTHARDVKVIGNHFERVADDCIALHSRDDFPDDPVPFNLSVVGNTMIASQGIRVLGAKNTTIANNTMRYMQQSPISILGNTSLPEGNTPIYSVNITGNTILDTMSIIDTNFVMEVVVRDRTLGGVLTKQPGAVAPIYPYADLNDTDTPSGVNIGAFSINIADNVISWTAKRGSAFSAYGVGKILNRDSAYGDAEYIDPTITDASYRCRGIYVSGPIRALNIHDNIFTGGAAAPNCEMVYITATVSPSNTIVGAGINLRDNSFSDCAASVTIGVYYPNENTAASINICGNSFDLDPFFRNSSHNADNTWSSDDACVPISFNGRVLSGLMDENHFKNCSRLFAIGGSPILVTNNNYAYFSFDNGSLVFDGIASNRGIRNVPFVPQVTCMIIDGDPASVTFGRTVTNPMKSASAQPTTGKYVRGHCVRNVDPVVAGTAGSQYAVSAWVRQTNSDLHAASDWLEMRSQTGT